ncbi:hypothetical protein [Thermococcus sp.]
MGIECLKEKGLEITLKVIVENREIAYKCDLRAIDGELRLSFKEGNIE